MTDNDMTDDQVGALTKLIEAGYVKLDGNKVCWTDKGRAFWETLLKVAAFVSANTSAEAT